MVPSKSSEYKNPEEEPIVIYPNPEIDAHLSDEEKNTTRVRKPRLKPEQRMIYKEALRSMNESGVTYAVGASFARNAYTNIWRHTKDLDIFLKPEDLRMALDCLSRNGFTTEVTDTHWLAKAWKGDYFVDLIFGTGHGHIPVDDNSFKGSRNGEILGVPVKLIPLEEMIASAAYIIGRNRFDGGEIVHLIRHSKGKLDWERILNRLGENRELLLFHLIHFDFVYPGHSNYLPQGLMVKLFKEIQERWKGENRGSKGFRGMLIDPFSYNVDVKDWGYEDRRKLTPLVDRQGEVV